MCSHGVDTVIDYVFVSLFVFLVEISTAVRVKIAYFSVLLCNKFLGGTHLHTARRQPLIGMYRCTTTGLDTDDGGRDVVIMKYK